MSSSSCSSASKEAATRFTEGERILCFHGPLIYEAKVQKVQKMAEKDASAKYFIHYRGWNKNWDEWVPEARILKYTEYNVDKQQDLIRAHEANLRAKKSAAAAKRMAAAGASSPTHSPELSKMARVENATTTTTPSSSKPLAAATTAPASVAAGTTPTGSGASIKSRGSKGQTDEAVVQKQQDISIPDGTVETEEQFLTKVEVRIKIPDELKPYLVNDWEKVVRLKKVCVLPARITVDQILNDYVHSKTSCGPPTSQGRQNSVRREDAVLEATAGIKEYFNAMLGSQLLFKCEREQHADIRTRFCDRPMSKVYGAIHLLRLFVKLGAMLTYTPLDEKSIQLLLFYIHDFLYYIKKNSAVFFNDNDYEAAPAVPSQPPS